MSDLTFDQAYEYLRSTMPGAVFYEFERHGDVDKYGLPTGQKAATVICYESRLTNAIRKIGGWTFLIDNRFISYHVQKITMMWLLHEGGTQYGELALMRSLRYCFKRFYAECLVMLGKPPVGRALLLENIIFERQFIYEMLEHTSESTSSEASQFNRISFEISNQAVLICQRHELGHYLLSCPGENILDNAAKLLDGFIVPSIRLLIEEGNHSLAEEVFCDAFALDSIVKTETDYLNIDKKAGSGFYSALHLDEVRAAYFSYNIIMRLTRIWLLALQDSRTGWDPAEQGSKRPNYSQHPLDKQANERSYIISSAIHDYVILRKGSIHDYGAKLYFNPRWEQLVTQAAMDIDQLSDVDKLSIIGESEREIARFLSAGMSFSSNTSQFLVDFSREREHSWWARVDELVESESEPSTKEAALQSNIEINEASAIIDTFTKAVETIYSSYTKIFDSIVVDIMFNNLLQDETLARLEDFKMDVFSQIDEFGSGEEAYEKLLVKEYVDSRRKDYKKKILELNIILLTLMKSTYPGNEKLLFSIPIKERLSCIEGYATRNQGMNVASLVPLLIPELDTGQVLPTKLF